MTHIPLGEVKRWIDIENILVEIEKSDIEIKGENSIKILNIAIDYLGDLDIKDMEYIDIAIKLPFLQIEKFYNAYKLKQDKIKESQLIEYLMKIYNMDKYSIIKRIDQINRIKNVEIKDLYHKVNREGTSKNKGGKK